MQYNENIGYKLNSRVKATLGSIAYYPFHLHKSDIEIIAVLNGGITISDSAMSYQLTYGDVYIFNANVPHKIVSQSSDDIVLTIQIDLLHYNQFFSNLPDAYFICDTFYQGSTYNMNIKYLRFLLARIFDLYLDNSKDYIMEDAVKELLALLLDNFQEYTYKKDADGKARIIRLQNADHIYKDYSRMYEIVDYVAEHFHEDISLKKIAEREFLSTSHLSRYIKETLGLTFSELVSLTRCEEAERLLSATKMTVDQIANAVGFSSRQHLATQFKRWFSRTPTEYRDEILSDLSSASIISLRPFDYAFSEKIINMYLDEY